MRDNGFNSCVPSGNTLIDGFKEPEPPCEVCEETSDLEADDDGKIICSHCRQDAADEGCFKRGY